MRRSDGEPYGKVVVLSRLNGHSVELRGYAVEQWQEISKLRGSTRAQAFLADVSLWAQQRVLAPRSIEHMDIVIDARDNVACVTYRSATLIHLSYGQRVVVFWLSGLFRPLSEFESPLRPTLH